MKKLTQLLLLYVLSLSANAANSQFGKMYTGLKKAFEQGEDQTQMGELKGLWKTRSVVRSAPGRRVFWQGSDCPKDYDCQDLEVKEKSQSSFEVCLLNSEKSEVCASSGNSATSVKFSDGGDKANIFRECRYTKSHKVYICRTSVGSGKVEFSCLSRSGYVACQKALDI